MAYLLVVHHALRIALEYVQNGIAHLLLGHALVPAAGTVDARSVSLAGFSLAFIFLFTH